MVAQYNYGVHQFGAHNQSSCLSSFDLGKFLEWEGEEEEEGNIFLT